MPQPQLVLLRRLFYFYNLLQNIRNEILKIFQVAFLLLSAFISRKLNWWIQVLLKYLFFNLRQSPHCWVFTFLQTQFSFSFFFCCWLKCVLSLYFFLYLEWILLCRITSFCCCYLSNYVKVVKINVFLWRKGFQSGRTICVWVSYFFSLVKIWYYIESPFVILS